MINIGILLDVCGIVYSETQLLKLETLVNNLIKNLLEKNSSDNAHSKSWDEPVKEEFFDENILEIKGQLISKCLFVVSTFFQKPMKTSRKVVKSNLFVSVLKET